MGERDGGDNELTCCDYPLGGGHPQARMSGERPELTQYSCSLFPTPHSPFSRSPISQLSHSPTPLQKALLLTRDIEKLLCYYACEYGKRTGWQAAGAPSQPPLFRAASPWNQAVLIPSDRANALPASPRRAKAMVVGRVALDD